MKDDLAVVSEINVATDSQDSSASVRHNEPGLGLADGLVTLLGRAGFECAVVATESWDDRPPSHARPLTVH